MKESKSAGGVVVNNKEGKILVVKQGSGSSSSWSLLKGHIDDGESALSAAKREIYEESGIAEDRLRLIDGLGSYERYRISAEGGEDKSEWKKIFMFLFRTDESNLKPVDPENPRALWIDKNKVVDLLTHQKDREFFLSIIDRIEE